MKNAITIILLVVAMCANAQGIYTKVKKYDKFDDVVWEKQIKTLITKTDSTFVIETKGSKPETYKYLEDSIFTLHRGSKDSLVNLVNDVWGYESIYVVMTANDLTKFRNEAIDELKNSYNFSDSLITDELINICFYKFILNKILLSNSYEDLTTITIRNVSTNKYYYEYDTDIFWIRFKDGSRIIYYKR